MDVSFSPNGGQLAAVSLDRTLRIQNVESHALLGALGFGGTVFIVQAAGPGSWWVGQAGAQVWRMDLSAQLRPAGGPR